MWLSIVGLGTLHMQVAGLHRAVPSAALYKEVYSDFK